MPSRNPWSYQKRRNLRPTEFPAPAPRFSPDSLLIHKYPTEQTLGKLKAADGQSDSPNRPEFVEWKAPEAT